MLRFATDFASTYNKSTPPLIDLRAPLNLFEQRAKGFLRELLMSCPRRSPVPLDAASARNLALHALRTSVRGALGLGEYAGLRVVAFLNRQLCASFSKTPRDGSSGEFDEE